MNNMLELVLKQYSILLNIDVRTVDLILNMLISKFPSQI